MSLYHIYNRSGDILQKGTPRYAWLLPPAAHSFGGRLLFDLKYQSGTLKKSMYTSCLTRRQIADPLSFLSTIMWISDNVSLWEIKELQCILFKIESLTPWFFTDEKRNTMQLHFINLCDESIHLRWFGLRLDCTILALLDTFFLRGTNLSSSHLYRSFCAQPRYQPMHVICFTVNQVDGVLPVWLWT